MSYGSLFEIGKSGLLASQYAMNVIAHNVANANTPGFHRQNTEIATSTPELFGGYWMGRGVSLQEISRDYSSFVETQITNELSRQALFDEQTSILRQVEDLFSEDSYGLSGALQDFFNAWDEVAANPESQAQRMMLIEKGDGLAASSRSMAERIYDMRVNMNQEIPEMADQVNALITRISELNSRVMETSGAGDILDERDRVINELATYFPTMNRFQDEFGRVTLIVQGRNLVDPAGYASLATQADANGFYDVIMSDTGDSLDLSSASGGRFAALLQMRDTTLVGYQDRLDTLMYSVVNEVNTLHAAGYGLDGETGRNFFLPLASSSAAAQSISVALTDGDQVAASSSSTELPGNNEQARAISQLQDQLLVGGTTYGNYYRSLVVTVGIDSQTAREELAASESVMLQLEARRDETSGVSLDEEAANLIRYQRAYEASARIIRVTDDLFETLMNLG